MNMIIICMCCITRSICHSYPEVPSTKFYNIILSKMSAHFLIICPCGHVSMFTSTSRISYHYLLILLFPDMYSWNLPFSLAHIVINFVDLNGWIQLWIVYIINNAAIRNYTLITLYHNYYRSGNFVVKKFSSTINPPWRKLVWQQ